MGYFCPMLVRSCGLTFWIGATISRQWVPVVKRQYRVPSTAQITSGGTHPRRLSVELGSLRASEPETGQGGASR